jgi:hypothetical protein
MENLGVFLDFLLRNFLVHGESDEEWFSSDYSSKFEIVSKHVNWDPEKSFYKIELKTKHLMTLSL